MELQKLYHLVHNIGRSERKAFSRWMKFKGSSLDLLLYNRILSAKVLSSDKEDLIRGSEFANASQFYIYRNRLAEHILNSMSASSENPISLVSFINNAIGWDMVDAASRVLSKEMEKAANLEDYSSLLYWYDFVSVVEAKANVKILLPESTLSCDQVRKNHDFEYRIQSIIQSIREAIKLPQEKRASEANRIQSHLDSLESNTKSGRNLLLLARRNLLVLEGMYDLALELGKHLLDQMLSWPEKYSGFQTAKEMVLLSLISSYAGDRSQAIHYSMRISNIIPSTFNEECQIGRLRIRACITTGEYYADLPMCESGYAGLESHFSLFPPYRQKRLLMLSGLTYFYHGKHAKAVSAIRKCLEISNDGGGRLTWEPYFMLALLHFELGNEDILDSLLLPVVRLSKLAKNEFPTIALKFFNQLRKAPQFDRKAIIGRQIGELTSLFENTSENRAADFFPMQYWLQSKYSNQPLNEIIQGLENRMERMNTLIRIA
jgi:hypothetical protein